MEKPNIKWYEDDELTIGFSEHPHVCVRYILPSSTPDEVKSIKKYPFICKTTLKVKLFDHEKEEIYDFTVPKGYCYDGATIPKLFWRIIGSNTDNSFLIPALIHDVLCENHHYINNDREFSTKVFDALLEVAEVPAFKRFLMKNSVDFFQRFCGWSE
jgi:hypothetical protein